jgi:hypothetical protein
MNKSKLLLVAFFLSFALLASASPVTYDITINTSSIAGTVGSVDFNFNPLLLTTQAASLQILYFSTDGTLAGTPALTGDVSGALPSAVTFDNGTGYNDYFEGFTFGSTLTFDVSLYGPALSAPNGVSTLDSTFAFSIFSDAAGTIPALTTDTSDGFAFIVNVNPDGSTTVTDYSDQTTVEPQSSIVPEPGSLWLVAIGLILIAGVYQRRTPQLSK